MFRKTIDWVQALARWLLEPAPVWIAIGVVALAILSATWLAPTANDALRYAGAFLELFGVLTVAKGIRDKRMTFQRPSFWQQALRWIERFPRFSRNIHVHVGTGGITLGGMAVQGHATVGASPNATLEQRVSALERQVESVQQVTIQVRQDLLHHAERLNTRITEESRVRADADKSIRDRLESLGADNLHVEAVGIVWLITGLMLSALPGEVLALLGL